MEHDSTIRIDGTKARQLRERQKLTQLYVATAVGVTTDTISRWENKHYPSIKKENGLKLAEALSVSLDELLEQEVEPVTSADNNFIQTDKGESVCRTGEKAALKVVSLSVLILVCLAGVIGFLLWNKGKVGLGAVRYLPASVLPDNPFPVLLKVGLPDKYDSSLMIRETIPEGCKVVNSVPPLNTQNKSANVLKWIKNVKGGEFAVYYLLSCPSSGEDDITLKFSGTVLAGDKGSAAIEVAGNNVVKLGHFHWADVNRDHVIDDYEMLSVYELFPEYVHLGINTAEIENIWASNGYRWHDDKKELEIVQGDSD